MSALGRAAAARTAETDADVRDSVPRWAPLATWPLAVIGIGLSAYLTWVHYAEPKSLSCPDTGVINCTKVTTSAQSMVFGIPVALLGALFFVAMAGLCLPVAWRSANRLVAAARLIGAIGGVGMVVYLVYVEAFVVHALCLWCTAVHVVMFALFVTVLAATLLEPAPDPDVEPES